MLKIANHKIYNHQLPEGHRFPMIKYELLPFQLLHEGIVEPHNFFEPEPLEEKWILSTHCANYWEKLKTLTLSKSEIRRLIKSNGIKINNQLANNEKLIIENKLFLEKGFIKLSIGKKKHYKIII